MYQKLLHWLLVAVNVMHRSLPIFSLTITGHAASYFSNVNLAHGTYST